MKNKPSAGDGAIIALANQKGGVGKTTLAVHLAVGAARAGRRVILVDADPQGNATSWMMDGQLDADGVYELLLLNAAPVKLVRGLRGWGVGLLPGNYRTGEALSMLGAVGKLDQIVGRIRPLARSADLVLVDMPPSRMGGFTEILSAADWVIVPTQLERLSLEGVRLLAQTVQEMGTPRLMGVVPNMCRARTREHQAQMDDLIRAFGPAIWPPIPLTIRVTEAASYGKTLFDLCPSDEVTSAMHQVVARMLEVIDG